MCLHDLENNPRSKNKQTTGELNENLEDTTDEEDEDERRPSFDGLATTPRLSAGIKTFSSSASLNAGPTEEPPSANHEMMYTGFVLLILNGGIYVLNYPNVFETRPYQWYVILVLVNFLIWHLVDQNFASKHQMLSRVSMMMAKSRDGNVSRKTSSRGKKTPRSKKKNRKNNVEIAPLPRGAFETSVESDSSIVGECDAKLFKIRSKKYKKTRKKVSCLKISRIVSHTHTYTHNKYQVHSTNDMYEFMTMH